MGYGKGFDTESFEAGAESLSFHRCSGFSVVSLAFPAGGGPRPLWLEKSCAPVAPGPPRPDGLDLWISRVPGTPRPDGLDPWISRVPGPLRPDGLDLGISRVPGPPRPDGLDLSISRVRPGGAPGVTPGAPPHPHNYLKTVPW